jgi:ParB family chromosome partitioning protein
VLEIGLIENLQRSDLNPIEEADGYAVLAQKFHLTQEQIAEKVGKSRASVANALRLRSLEQDVKEMVRFGRISVGHAKVLLGLSEEDAQRAAALEIVKRDLSVRATESFVRKIARGAAGGKKRSDGRSADWRDLEQRLQRKLGTKVRLVGSADKGRIEIDYYSNADLERLLETLGVGDGSG